MKYLFNWLIILTFLFSSPLLAQEEAAPAEANIDLLGGDSVDDEELIMDDEPSEEENLLVDDAADPLLQQTVTPPSSSEEDSSVNNESFTQEPMIGPKKVDEAPLVPEEPNGDLQEVTGSESFDSQSDVEEEVEESHQESGTNPPPQQMSGFENATNFPSEETFDFKRTVIIDPSDGVRIDYKRRKTYLLPYSRRRLEWGGFYGLSAGIPNPADFENQFVVSSFEEVYGVKNPVLLEFHGSVKKNFSTWSWGGEFGLGNYSVRSDKDIIDSKLNVTYLKFGSQIALDNLFDKEPYIVPYVSGGVYIVQYEESQYSVTKGGSTEASFYATGGVMFDIDWLDEHAAVGSYFEGGIENTFLFIEATYFLENQNAGDPNFAGLNMNAGFKIEM